MSDPQSGALNLLKNCLGVRSGDSVLMVLEPTDELYDPEVGVLIRSCLDELRAVVTVVVAPMITEPADFPDCVAVPMARCDHTLFLSRVGDYVRFVALPGSGSRATSYTLTSEMLGAPYAAIDNRLLLQLQQRLEDELMRAKTWHIECPLGTDISGQFCWQSLAGGEDDDLTVTLFPVATFKPVPCDNATGQVALSRWLMPGGAAKLDSADMSIDGVVMANVSDGHLGSFSGALAEVGKLNQHYDYISKTLGINRTRVHSWHAGINPQTTFKQNADDHLDRWSAISFGSPRYLHFHTCGDEPPGEVAWSVFNPTVSIDGERYWENGHFIWLHRPENKALIDSCQGGHFLLQPSLPIGIDNDRDGNNGLAI